MALRSILRSALLLLLAPALAVSAQQFTQITATSVNAGGAPITGTLCFTAVDRYGNPIPVTKQGGGFYKAASPFCGTLNAGALSGTLSVPNSLNDSAAGHGYSLVIFDQATGLSSDPMLINGIGGTTWSLDNYIPSATVSTTNVFTFTTGSGSHPVSCTAPAMDVRVNSGVADMAVCSNGSFTDVTNSAGNPASTSTAADQIYLTTAANAATWSQISACANDGMHSLGYNVTSHSFTCGSIASTPVTGPQYKLPAFSGSGSGSSYALGPQISLSVRTAAPSASVPPHRARSSTLRARAKISSRSARRPTARMPSCTSKRRRRRGRWSLAALRLPFPASGTSTTKQQDAQRSALIPVQALLRWQAHSPWRALAVRAHPAEASQSPVRRWADCFLRMALA